MKVWSGGKLPRFTAVPADSAMIRCLSTKRRSRCYGDMSKAEKPFQSSAVAVEKARNTESATLTK